MLILARKVGEAIRIGDDIKLTVVRLRRNEVRLGFEAPREIEISIPRDETREEAKDEQDAESDSESAGDVAAKPASD